MSHILICCAFGSNLWWVTVGKDHIGEKTRTQMLCLGQAAPTGALCTSICSGSSSSSSLSSPLKLIHPKSVLFSKIRTKCIPRRPLTLTLARADGGADSASAATKQQRPPSSATPLGNDDTVSVGEDGVPLEGVIQFEKPDSVSHFQKWGGIAFLAGGDVLVLLAFAAIGRFSHGFSVFDVETLRTADPFIAGWFLSAYFLGGYGEEGRGMNGLTKAVVAATKSWALGMPLGLVIRAVSVGHLPPTNFILVTMGSTAILLIGWRTLLFRIFPNERSKKDDMYKRGNPFELFEILMKIGLSCSYLRTSTSAGALMPFFLLLPRHVLDCLAHRSFSVVIIVVLGCPISSQLIV